MLFKNGKMKNISKSQVLTLKDEVAYQDGMVVSKTLVQNDAVSVTLFSFDKGEEISTHESSGDAFVTCLDGVGKITVDGIEYILKEANQSLCLQNTLTQFSVKNALKCSLWLFFDFRFLDKIMFSGKRRLILQL